MLVGSAIKQVQSYLLAESGHVSRREAESKSQAQAVREHAREHLTGVRERAELRKTGEMH